MADKAAGAGPERVEAGDWPSRVEVQHCCLLGNPAPKSKAHYQVDVYWCGCCHRMVWPPKPAHLPCP
eukprot:COSAG01_NODE_36155_length_521_cov_1.383886_1_plen_66_part_01